MPAALLILAIGLLLLALIQTPSWILYAAAGSAIGAGMKAIYSRLRSTQHLRRNLLLVAGGMLLVGIIVTVSIPNLQMARDMAMPRELTAEYSADVRLDQQENSWHIRDSLQLEIRDRAYYRVHGEAEPIFEPTEMEAWLSKKMLDEGWHADEEAAERLTFYRDRTESVRQQWFAPHTANDLYVPHIESLVPDIRLTPLRDATLTMHVPLHLVSRTEPGIAYRTEDQADTEQIFVEFDYRDLPKQSGDRFVMVELMHPMFQNGFVIAIRKICDLPFIHWAIMGVCGAFNTRVRERLVEPWSKRLVHWVEHQLPGAPAVAAIAANDENPTESNSDLLPIGSRRYATLFSALRRREVPTHPDRDAA